MEAKHIHKDAEIACRFSLIFVILWTEADPRTGLRHLKISQGGKIVGFGDTQSGLSANYDRHVYLDNSGHVIFGVYNSNAFTVSSANTYNDGAWHQVVAELSGSGMALYVDGVRVGTNSGTT